MNKPIDNPKRHRGVIVPMVTPLNSQGDLDESAARRIMDHLFAGGVSGVFVLGTTGEYASVPQPARLRLVEIACRHTAGRGLVYAGIGDTCLAHSAQAAEAYFQLGVDAVVAHPPGYYPLTAAEIEAYFEALASRIAGPLIVYNIPSTTHVSIPIEVVEKLSRHPRIAAVKDSEPDAARLQRLIRAVGRPDFSVLIGTVELSASGLLAGADGLVPSTGNVLPALCQAVYRAASQGEREQALAYQRLLDESTDLYRKQGNLGAALAGLKAMMGVYDLCGPGMWPPVLALEPARQQALQAEFRQWLAQNPQVNDVRY